MIRPNNAVLDQPAHAKNGASRSPRYGRPSGDEVLSDLLATSTALSLDLASTGLKQLAIAGKVSPSRASRWRKTGRGNPVYDVTQVIYWLTHMGQNSGAIVSHAQTTLHHALLPVSDDDLVERFWRLMGTESEAEGRENRATSMFGATGDLETIERAMLDEAGIQTELAAVCRELRRREIDPRTHVCN